ncbi:hypothetical protein [Bifidobacterium vansinderenii]|uniref:Uncharacterized protein n=1 Tax=Bifidobacterium vansinderenii TaxID=1984871 RepID=A0A229VZK4_9BIFI|nr:hypothetical protein [Bifidobacterium vansinderenii]OXN01047.1 hypothetical protein Tam10B_0625 [Bifidobacterium vansinderenii]
MTLISHLPYDPKWIALQREASMSGRMLSLGLHALLDADYMNQELYYTGFFNITIALERIYKLILESHEYSTNGSFLTDNQLKNEGHDLLKLYERTQKSINPVTKKLNDSPTMPDEELTKVLTFLTDFAKKDRYFNFVSLGKKGAADPVSRWHRLVLKWHKQPPLTQEQLDILTKAQMQDNQPRSLYDINYFDERGNNLESNEQCQQALFLAEHVQRAGTLILFKIAKAATNQLCSYSNLYDPKTQSEIYRSSNHLISQKELEQEINKPQPLQLPNFEDFFTKFHQSEERYLRFVNERQETRYASE